MNASAGSEAARPVAAVDCGTNSTRLLVAGPGGACLERLMRITRLGEGVDRTGRVGAGAIGRTLDVLAEYRQVMDRHDVGDAMATATSAVRDASNAEDFLAAAASVLGCEPRVLAGKEEGRLSYRGATAELEAGDGPFLVVDVGGGSTELVAVSAGGDPSDVVVESLQAGCVRVSERFLHGDPPTPAEQSSARRFVGALVAGALEREPDLRRAKTVVGLAGTVSALAMLNLRLTTYDRGRVHHSVLGREDVERLCKELAAVSLAARRERPGLETDRADVIIGGAIVLGAVMEGVGAAELLVSESDILDGIVAELLDAGTPAERHRRGGPATS